jgi:hypothetical protein
VSTAREQQITEALNTRRRQVEDALEHERFDLRVQRGEWPTAKVGVLFGIDLFTVDATVPALALMGYTQHSVVTFYESRLLGPPLGTAQEILTACELAAYGCRKQWFVSSEGWRKLRRSLKEHQNDANHLSPDQPHSGDFVAAPLEAKDRKVMVNGQEVAAADVRLGIDFGHDPNQPVGTVTHVDPTTGEVTVRLS